MRILLFSTYPIRKPVHGGQRRCRALCDALRLSGHHVRSIGVYNKNFYSPLELGDHDIYFSGEFIKKISSNSQLEDLLVATNLPLDSKLLEQLIKSVIHFEPEVIYMEQPYLWPAIKKIRDLGYIQNCKFHYGSQNIEYEMKARIYEQVFTQGEVESLVKKVKDIEEDIVREVDCIVAVTEGDKLKLLELGAKCPILIVPNGSDSKTSDLIEMKNWENDFKSNKKRATAFFVSSWHMPNIMGFAVQVGPYLGYLPPDAQIVFAGSGSRVAHEVLGQDYLGVNSNRLRLVSSPSDSDIASLMQLAHVVLLPITEGGGSNLKTAEALLSGRPILATSYSFRSYEKFINRRNVYIADEPSSYKKMLRELLTKPFQKNENASVNELTWSYIGSKFVLDFNYVFKVSK